MVIGTTMSSIRTMYIVAAVLYSIGGVAVTNVSAQWAPLQEDNVSIRTDLVTGPDPGPRSWADSYSDGDSCYCATTFDHDLALVMVDTPLGILSVKEVCDLMGNGPTGSRTGRPLYNDIQCGNGPSVVPDEDTCPGRTEYGQEGCKYIGPKWNFAPHLPTAPVKAPVKAPVVVAIPIKAPITAPVKPPTKAPIKAPVKAPTKVPDKAPVQAPTKAPVKLPVKVTTKAPTVITKEVPTPISSTTTCQIVQLNLYDTVAKTISISNMVNDMKICNSFEFSIDAIATKACAVGSSLKFQLTGPNSNTISYTRNEGKPPYCLYGNSGALIYGKALSVVGMYTLSVTPQPQPATKTVTFEIVNC